MNDKREIKNAVIATVIGGLIISVVLWCVNNFSMLRHESSSVIALVQAWVRSSEFVFFALLLFLFLLFRHLRRPTIKSRIATYRNRIFHFFRFPK